MRLCGFESTRGQLFSFLLPKNNANIPPGSAEVQSKKNYGKHPDKNHTVAVATAVVSKHDWQKTSRLILIYSR